MKTIDLNVDAGESFYDRIVGQDAELIPLASSVNLACGFHGGDPLTIDHALKLCAAKKIAVGAHPSYYDLQGFGRTEQSISPDLLYAQLAYQIAAMKALAESRSLQLKHVKPHGALYHRAMTDPVVIDTFLSAVARVAPKAAVVGIAGAPLLAAARNRGITPIAEAFADRRYENADTLVSRSAANALIGNSQDAARQALSIVRDNKVQTAMGQWVSLDADTICVHGDQPGALELLKAVRTALEKEGYVIASA